MAQDATLEVGLQVDEQSLEQTEQKLSAGVQAEDMTGGGGGGQDDQMSILAEMSETLGRILGAVAVLTAIPKLLGTLTRLVTLTLLPIAALFNNLLAPVLAKVAKRLGEGDIFSQVRRFASQVISFAKDMRNLIAQVETFFQAPLATIRGTTSPKQETTSMKFGPKTPLDLVEDFATSPQGASLTGGISPLLVGGIEFTSSVWQEGIEMLTQKEEQEGGAN